MFEQTSFYDKYIKLDNGWIKASKIVGIYKECQPDATFDVKVLDITSNTWIYERCLTEADADIALTNLIDILTGR
mgnify:CR=1 FL=1